MRLFFIPILFCFLSCTNITKRNYSYYIDNSIGEETKAMNSNDGFTKTKFISYENYLFEFITEQVTNTTVVGNKSTVSSTSNTLYIYVMEKGKKTVVKIDSFYTECKIEEITSFSKKNRGVIIKNPDSGYKEEVYSKNLRDTIINNIKAYVKDTSFLFADTMPISTYSFYVNNANLITIFNVNKSNSVKNGLCYLGSKVMYRKLIAAQFLIKDLANLSETDSLICKKIIEKIKNYKP
jgi:hypothetical protein